MRLSCEVSCVADLIIDKFLPSLPFSKKPPRSQVGSARCKQVAGSGAEQSSRQLSRSEEGAAIPLEGLQIFPKVTSKRL